jgi:hypothetical protein
MSSESWIETDVCLKCDGPVAILFNRYCTAQGTWLPLIMQRILCLNGCVGRGVLDPAHINRIA